MPQIATRASVAEILPPDAVPSPAQGRALAALARGATVTAAAIDQSHDIVGTLSTATLDRHATNALNIRFVNMFFAFLSSQRGYLYGLPLAFAVVATLLVAVRRANVRLFIVAGVVAGLLPLAHLGTLLALAIVTPVLVLLFPSRAWIAFFVAWIDGGKGSSTSLSTLVSGSSTSRLPSGTASTLSEKAASLP